MPYFTFADAVDSLMRYAGMGPSQQNLVDCLQSIDEAYYDLINAHTWSYLYAQGRILLNLPCTTGTISYRASGGAYPYQVTLAGGTWPSWAADGYIYAGGVTCRVDRRIDDTTLTLQYPLVFPADIQSGGYVLYQDSFLLPEDFIAGDQALYQMVFGALQYVHPREWMFSHRYYYYAGVPQFYTIDADIKYPGRLVIRLAPLPSQPLSLDFLYKRRPRPLRIQNSSSGTVSVTAGSATVTGSGTAFAATMAPWLPGQGGSVLRVSGNASAPTWMPQGNPGVFEAQVYSVASATSLQLMPLTPSTVTFASAPYAVSDPVDIEVGSMRNAFLRCCESKLSQHRIMKDKPSAKGQYLEALRRAKEADSRSFAGRAEGEAAWHRQMMKDMPMGPDMS